MVDAFVHVVEQYVTYSVNAQIQDRAASVNSRAGEVAEGRAAIIAAAAAQVGVIEEFSGL